MHATQNHHRLVRRRRRWRTKHKRALKLTLAWGLVASLLFAAILWLVNRPPAKSGPKAIPRVFR